MSDPLCLYLILQCLYDMILPLYILKSTRAKLLYNAVYDIFFSPYLPAGVSFFYIPENNLQFPFVFPVTSAIYHRN